MLTLSPAHGRDYTSQKQVKADWDAEKDFIIETFINPYSGKLCNKQDIIRSGEAIVHIRYNRLTKSVMIFQPNKP